MAKPLTLQTAGTVGGAAALVACFGLYAYFYFGMTPASPQAPVSKQYNASTLNAELDPNNQQSVFLSLAQLKTVSESQPENTTYSATDLGKTDITQVGK